MEVVLGPLLRLVLSVIGLYMWVVVIAVVLSWLMAFNVINRANRFVFIVADFIYRITEPALRPIRRLLPNLGGIDLSPVVLILVLYFLRDLLSQMLFRLG